ncbi:MAG: hypothetical protein EOP84_12585 [Verrucomicrobiaceae bacterium]|nr:MAG: hypothetical protein EOP84_12585 [Verrucomicrobiaceae bacterium]
MEGFDMLAKFELGIGEGDPSIMRGHPLFDVNRFNAKESLRKAMQLEWFRKTQRGEAACGMTVGEVALGNLIPAGGDETAEGIDAILTGMVTGLWTAFEVLVEDVWKAATAARPVLESSMTDKERQISGFRSTKRIRHLYGFTFRTDESAIFRILNDERIDALSLTRNLIVHTGGIVDAEFDTRRVTIPWLSCFAANKRGDRINLSGQTVHHLLNPIPTLGLDLVQSVDLWLIAHP